MQYFTAIGSLGFNSLDSKLPYIRTGKTKGGQKYQSFNVSVIAAKNNRVFTSVFGMESDEIKTMDTDNNKISIAWGDRFDENVISSVAGFRKFVANITGDDRKEFITGWDFVEYLQNNKKELENGRFIIRGQVRPNIYKGKVTPQFDITSILKADEDSKNKIEVSLDYFYSADSVDIADFNSEKKVFFNGYTYEYISQSEGYKYIPMQTILNCSKLDENNEQHMKRRNFNLKMMGIDCVDNKLSVKLKKKNIYKIGIVCAYNNGAEEIEFDESTLTASQKMAIELGINTLDDFKPKGQIYGNRTITYNIKQLNLSKYPDGVEDTEVTVKEFEEDVYSTTEETTDVIEKAVESSNTDTDDIDDLFA